MTTPRNDSQRERVGGRNRPARLAACLAVALLSAGCGLGGVAHRGGDVTRGGALAVSHDALSQMREQAALAPADPYWPFHEAELMIERDSLRAAEAALATALQRDPRHVPSLLLLSKLWYEGGRHAEGVRLLEAARADADSFAGGFPPALLAALALHDDALGRWEEVDRLRAQLPDDDATRSTRVFLGLRGPAPDSVAALAAAAVREAPRSAAHHNNFGILRLRAGDPVTARREFLAAIRLDPACAGPYYNLAILEKFYAFDDDAARRWFTAYRRRSHDDPDSLFAVFGNADPKNLAGEEREP